jgi:hypothetical protein
MTDNFLGRGRISPGRRGRALVSLPDSLFKQEWPDPITTKRIFLLRRKRGKRGLFYTDKKENEIFLINKEFQMGLVAKSYMRKGFLIYEEMRKYLTTYEEAVSHI